MSRKIKNIVMVVLLIALCVCMHFTINNNFKKGFPNNKTSLQIEGIRMPEDMENMGNPPEMPNDMQWQMAEPPDVQNMSEPPKKLEKGMEQMPRNDESKNMMQVQNKPENNFIKFNQGNSKLRILCAIETATILVILIYLIISNFNAKTLKETLFNKKIIIYILLIVVFTIIITTLIINLINKNNPRINNRFVQEENVEKETKAEDVDSGESINIAEKIILDNHSSNITITEPGTYTLTGKFSYSVLIDAQGEVLLNLENVTIENTVTAAIANISTNGLTINLPENTINKLTDGGSSEYDSCIYSAGPLTITGNGSLEVYGNQDEGEGIATETQNITIDGGNIKVKSNDDGLNAGGDGGTIAINKGNIYIKASGDGIDSNKNVVINGGNVYAMGSSLGGDAGMDADQGIIINGGTVIALGSDMLEMPKDTSKQKSLCFNLKSNIEAGTSIVLKDSNGVEVANFIADEKFKTLIISNNKLVEGKYTLYVNNEKVSETNIK